MKNPRLPIKIDHGTATRYRYGCRCERCGEAEKVYQRQRQRARDAERGIVRGPRPPEMTLDQKRELAAKVAAQQQSEAAREAAFLALDFGSDSRVCACGRCGASILARDFITNGHGATLAVCPRCDWHAPAASTRSVA